MAEAIGISVVGGLLNLLWGRIQQAKGIAKSTESELQLLKDFINQIDTYSKLWASDSSAGVGTLLKEPLADAEKKLKQWCSKSSVFLSLRSDDRLQQIRRLRQSVETAYDLEKDRRQGLHNRNVELLLERLGNQGKARNPKVKHPEPSPGSQQNTDSNVKVSGSRVSTKIRPPETTIVTTSSRQRSKSVERARTAKSPSQSPSKAPSSSRSKSVDSTRNHSRATDGKKPSTSNRGTRSSTTSKAEAPGSKITHSTKPATSDSSSKSKTVGSAGNRSSNRDGKMKRQQSWQNLWVPMDSEFQAAEVKRRLTGVQGNLTITTHIQTFHGLPISATSLSLECTYRGGSYQAIFFCFFLTPSCKLSEPFPPLLYIHLYTWWLENAALVYKLRV